MLPMAGLQDELVDQMDISGSLEDLQDQNVIVYLLRMFRDKYYSKVRRWPCRRTDRAGVDASGAATQGHYAHHRHQGAIVIVLTPLFSIH